jgi:hypothetical protein
VRHVQFDGDVRRGCLTALCGATISIQPLRGSDGVLAHTLGEDGEACPRCAAREAARRLGASFRVCGACAGTGRRLVDPPRQLLQGLPAIYTPIFCDACAGQGVYQWLALDGPVG